MGDGVRDETDVGESEKLYAHKVNNEKWEKKWKLRSNIEEIENEK